jgi:hypothetical protein
MVTKQNEVLYLFLVMRQDNGYIPTIILQNDGLLLLLSQILFYLSVQISPLSTVLCPVFGFGHIHSFPLVAFSLFVAYFPKM